MRKYAVDAVSESTSMFALRFGTVKITSIVRIRPTDWIMKFGESYIHKTEKKSTISSASRTVTAAENAPNERICWSFRTNNISKIEKQ